MNKKLSIIAALMIDTPIYIFDEPTSGLDLEATAFLYACLEKKLAEGKTIILSSHLTSGFEPRPDGIGLIKNGMANWIYPEKFQYSQTWFSEIIKKHYDLQ